MSSIIDVKKVSTKLSAGEKAVEYIKDGMVVGLGTGTTTMYSIQKLGKKINDEGIKIVGIPTSEEAERFAREAEIPVMSIDQVKEIDVTIAGADEVDNSGYGIKGTKGALMLEKMVSRISKKTIWVIDETKMVSVLGSVPLPVEVTAEGITHVLNHINKNISKAKVRRDKNGELIFTSRGHNFIDIFIDRINDPEDLDDRLKSIPGVIETGLFINMVNTIIIGKNQGVEIINYDR
jgi:ribose 5-phosphate isomerase A